MIRHFLAYVPVVHRLGLRNVGRVLGYRLGVKARISRSTRLRGTLPPGPYFRQPSGPPLCQQGPDTWWHQGVYFGWWRTPLSDKPPDWHCNPIHGTRSRSALTPWHAIPDFDPELGDIKTVWEASRFDWVLACARRALSAEDRSDPKGIERLNAWIGDWCAHNPAYLGANWKNGQEAAIRVMHLAVAALLLEEQAAPCPDLLALVAAHLTRIESTLAYAIGQRNNHATSEAAALFIGGSWLAECDQSRLARRWERLGRGWLEKLTPSLVSADGSFSQYSTNYHRLLLDTLSIVELWRRSLGLPSFSSDWLQRCRCASEWLRHFVQEETGRTPNLGANDSARLIPLTEASSLDFRPSVHLASTLFHAAGAYPGHEDSQHQLSYLRVDPPQRLLPQPETRLFPNGGFAVLRRRRATAFMRFPRFRFRPSQADALHVDLWVNGENYLRDAGSFSYAAPAKCSNYFSGTASHNTVRFDDHDQMPRLGRFLFGAWLQANASSPIKHSPTATAFSAAYRDYARCRHEREIRLEDKSLTVIDRVAGFASKAVLRWRLPPGDWSIDGQQLIGANFSLKVRSDVPIHRFSLIDGWESVHYLKKDLLPVLEVEVREPARLETVVGWK